MVQSHKWNLFQIIYQKCLAIIQPIGGMYFYATTNQKLKSKVKHSNASTPQFIKSIEYQIGNSNQGRSELFWHFNVLTSTKTSPQENILRLNVMSYFFQKINNSWNHAQIWQLFCCFKQKWYFPTFSNVKRSGEFSQ